MSARPLLQASVTAAVLALAACNNTKLTDQTAQTCKADSDCVAGDYCNSAGYCQVGTPCTPACAAPLTCDLSTGNCDCAQNSDCPSGEVCSAFHTCQAQSACNSNADCAPDGGDAGLICNTQTNTCIPSNTCGQDLDCPAGMGCNGGQCVPGCVTDGDCPLVDYSQNPPVFTPYACIDFECVKNGCHSLADCPFPDFCSSTTNTCVDACPTSGPLCQACDPTQQQPCPGNNNECLYDDRDTPGCQPGDTGCLFYCGIDCSKGQPCPSGTTCSIITVVSGQAGTMPDELCSIGQTCTDSNGGNPTPCPVLEGATEGSCPCYNDNDCANVDASCDTSDGSCYDGEQCAPDKQYNCPAGTGQCEGG